jgi:hypothetical protein
LDCLLEPASVNILSNDAARLQRTAVHYMGQNNNNGNTAPSSIARV